MSQYNGILIKHDNPCIVYHAYLEDIGRFDHKMVGYIVKKGSSVREYVSVFPDKQIQNGKLYGIMMRNGSDNKEYISGTMQSNHENLPYDSKIEYLRSTGTQYIDLGIPFEVNEIVEISFRFISYSSQDFTNIFGTTSFDDNYTYSVQISTSGTISISFGGKRKIFVRSTDPDDVRYGRHDASIDFSDGTLVFDETTYQSTGSNTPSNINIFLFAIHNADSVEAASNFSNSEIYSVKIGDRMDLIPVRIGQTGYMYDNISGTLFGNNGTGNFELGPDIP